MIPVRWPLVALLVALLLAPVDPARAQDDAALIPVRDLYALTRRLTGATVTPPPPLTADGRTRQPGERARFRVFSLGTERAHEVEATLRVVGELAYLWTETGLAVDDAVLADLAARLDADYLPAVRALWALPAPDAPDIDGEARIHILFQIDPAGGYGGYFSGDHLYPRAVSPHSSEHELLVMNAALLTAGIDPGAIGLIIAHEYQHLLRYQAGGGLMLWLNEAFSSYTEYALTGDSRLTAHFYAAPGTALTRWDSGSAAHYGAALDWLLYLDARCGPDAVRALAGRTNSGQRDLNTALADLPGCPLPAAAGLTVEETLFADWIAARARRFAALPLDRAGAQRVDLAPGGTAVFALERPAHPAALTLTAPALLPVLPDETPGPVWRTQRADLQMAELTLADLDLTDAARARLEYRIWYDIEPGFDYAYVLVNDRIVTPVTHTPDPYQRAFGPAYTGISGGWRDQSIDLTPFSGGRARISFLYVTDEGVQRPGVALEAIRAIVDEAPVDGSIQTAAGWVLRPPLLANRLLVQIIDRADGALLDRHLLDADALQTGRAALNLPAADGLLIAITPLEDALEVPAALTAAITPAS
ncbi:MAG: hypothetical protein ACUVS2_09700 [Candidatus Flexifilum sp.]|jgi:hypothetical protein